MGGTTYAVVLRDPHGSGQRSIAVRVGYPAFGTRVARLGRLRPALHLLVATNQRVKLHSAWHARCSFAGIGDAIEVCV